MNVFAFRCCAAMVCAGVMGAAAAEPGKFEMLGTYKGLGGFVASLVGPGPEPGSEWFYGSYLYADNTLEVVGIDPNTGRSIVYPCPAPTEWGGRNLAVGPDGNIYVGTLPAAHFLQLNPRTGKMIDLGRPSPTESYIWDTAVGKDGKIYGATYPGAKLVSYDPKTGKLTDHGRLDPVEQYARWIAADNDGFVYIGIGTTTNNIAAFDTATGQHKEILPAEYIKVGTAKVFRAVDGAVYASAGNRYFRMKGFSVVPVEPKDVPTAQPLNRTRDGRTITAQGRKLRIAAPGKPEKELAFEYAGNALPLFRIGFGPDGVLYGSAVLPIHFVKLDAASKSFPEIGDLGGGEFYSFLAKDKWLLMAGYSAMSPLMKWDPSKPFNVDGAKGNPELVNYPNSESAWRPQAFIDGPDGNVYLGATSGYGKLGGPLTVWEPKTNTITEYPHIVRDQSVNTLAVWRKLIVGGTTIGGGGGSRPTTKEATLFIFDPATKKKVFEMVPVPGARGLNDFITAPNGLVYGIAGSTFFAFDPESRTVKFTKPLPEMGPAIYNAVGIASDGKIWGLARKGIFRIDPATNEAALIDAAPKPITAGFALRDKALYFVSHASAWRYTLPAARR